MKHPKIAAVLACAVLAFTLTACGSSDNSSSTSTSKTPAATEDNDQAEAGKVLSEDTDSSSDSNATKDDSASNSSSSSNASSSDSKSDSSSSNASSSDSKSDSSSSSSSSDDKSDSSSSSSSSDSSDVHEDDDYINPAPAPVDVSTVPSLEGDAAGKFSSDTGTGMDIIVTWAVTNVDDYRYDIKAEIYLESYSIYVGATDGTFTMTEPHFVTTHTEVFKTAAVERDSGRATVKIGEVSCTTSKENIVDGIPVTVSWNFGGSYNGVKLTTVDASGTLKL